MAADTIFFLVLILFALIIATSIVYTSFKNRISPMPSNYIMHQAVHHVLDEYCQRATIVDAGSGFGHFLLKTAAKYEQHQFIGIESSLFPYLYSKALKSIIPSFSKLPVLFVKTDIYNYNYSYADIIVCYLYRGAPQQLFNVLRAHNKSFIFISIAFAIDHMKPDKTITCRDSYKTKIYVYHL